MDEDVKEALRLAEKIDDRHEAAIEVSRKEISELKQHKSQCDAQMRTIISNQEEIKKVQKELELWKSKLAGGIAAAVVIWEMVEAKIGF